LTKLEWQTYTLSTPNDANRRETMDEVEVKATWRLTWGLYWRMLLIGLGITVILWLIIFLTVGATLLPFLTDF
jgi:hypothetical protein